MVCDRCIAAVKKTLAAHQIPVQHIILGQVQIKPVDIDWEQLDIDLKKIGFSVIRDKNQILTERVKALLIEYIHYMNEPVKVNISDYLSRSLKMDYIVISKIFSNTAKITIEKFIIIQKIEKVKEFIEYGKLNFSEIAFRLHYSSVSHLSKQFKKITGLTLSEYRKQQNNERQPLDKL